MVELPQHEVHIDEDDGEAQDEVIDVSPDCPGGNVTKAVGNIDLGFKKKKSLSMRGREKSVAHTSTFRYFGSNSFASSSVLASCLSKSSVAASTISPGI